MKTFRKAIAAFVAVILCSAVSCNGQRKTDNTYKLQRAYEALLKDHDEDQALSLVEDQLKATPEAAEAYLLRAHIFRLQKKYGSALSDINYAIKVNKPRKSEVAMSTLHWWKGSIYSDMNHLESAAESYRTAVALARKDDRESLQQISFEYAQCLYQLGRLEDADMVYEEMLRMDEADQAARVGLARNMIKRGRYGDAVEPLLKASSYDRDYSAPYNFLSQAYDNLGETDKAIDYMLSFYDKDDDVDVEYCIPVLVKHSNYAEAMIKEHRKVSDDKIDWDMLMISLYEEIGKSEQAIMLYDRFEEDYGQDAFIYYSRAELYEGLGLYDKAIEQYTRALEKDPDYRLDVNMSLAYVYREEAKYDLAREMSAKVIDEMPSSAYGYYTLGWCWELDGDDEKAMEYYDMGIDIDKSYPHIFLMRGELLDKQGKHELAAADFETILQLDTVVSSNSCRMYALHFLGRDGESVEWMEKMIEADPHDAGNYYDKACLLSRMGRGEESVAALAKSFDLGYSHLAHVEHDDDLDFIRDREDYRSLMEKSRAILAERVNTLGDTARPVADPVVSEIGISRRAGGTFEVPCSVNGLSLNMLFDTGASDVTISSVEANFMLKNGHLGKDDVKGKRYYQIANGDIAEGTVIVLREVKVGDAVLRNVEASVVKSQKAPLLLGQSVMERFGTITIDNINSKLIIKQ